MPSKLSRPVDLKRFPAWYQEQLASERRDLGSSFFFDGTAHFETKNNVVSDPRAVDGRVGSLSLWWNPVTIANQQFLISFANPAVLEISQETSGKLTLFGFGDPFAVAFAVGMNNNFSVDGGWKHVLMSWDNQLADPTFHLYLDDEENLGGTTANDVDIAYRTGDRMRIGRGGSDASRFQGHIAELWIDVTTQIDFSVEANRRQFISADGRRADLGPYGTKPLGAKPYVYHKAGRDDFEKGRGAMPDLTVPVGPGTVTNHVGQVIRAKGNM